MSRAEKKEHKRVLGHAVLQKQAYDDCRVLSPEGVLMCKINSRRFEWYLKRNLAKKIDERTIQLLFTPKGLGNAEDKFYLSEMQNICVVCGTDSNYTKHHVIPHAIRRWCPMDYKASNSHDVVLLCSACHEAYETEAEKLKKQLCAQYKIPVNGTGLVRDAKIVQLQKLITAWRKYSKNIPASRMTQMKQDMNQLLGHADLNRDLQDSELDQAMEQSATDDSGFNSYGLLLVEALLGGKYESPEYFANAHRLEAFGKMWRKHFVQVMQPKFLNEHWDVDRMVKKREEEEVVV